MNIVLDTNVLVSGLLSPFGPPGKIVRMVSSGEIRLLFDARILSEYRDVLQREKFRFDPKDVEVLLDFILKYGHMVSSSPLRNPLPDPDDEPFLEAALAGQAACLVTGNTSHYPGPGFQGVNILSPADFIRRYKTE
jgi:uncharacterized protein